MEKEFELVPVQDKETGVYHIENFEENKKIVKDFLANECHVEMEINSAEDYKLIKNTRTDIRKKREAIKNIRIKVSEMLIGVFESQLKEIEREIDATDLILKEKIDAYDKLISNKQDKPSKITLTIKGYDMQKIQKVKDYAIKQGLEAAIK